MNVETTDRKIDDGRTAMETCQTPFIAARAFRNTIGAVSKTTVAARALLNIARAAWKTAFVARPLNESETSGT